MKLQNWIKLDFLFEPKFQGLNFASVPSVISQSQNVFRIIFSSRNDKNQSNPYFVDFDIKKLEIISKARPVEIKLGALGSFDDSGIMPSSFLSINNEVWMYYIGWNLGVTVPFRNSIGLAVSKDNGKSFTKKYNGPIIDRNKDEPFFVASNCVLFHEGIFKIWYLSCVKWEKIDGKIHHFYHIKYAFSSDGISWTRNNQVAIDFKSDIENAISVPRVIIEHGLYKMWYSYRDLNSTYRIGYAESFDGLKWTRLDDIVRLDLSINGWDNEMICYPFILDHEGSRYMLYNGNGYGRTGFGIAKLNDNQ